MSRLFLVGPFVLLFLAGCAKDPKSAAFQPRDIANLTLTSPAFGKGAIPKKYTADGEDLSPPLRWSGAPESTRSFVLLCVDPDGPKGTRSHWLLYNLPADRTELPEGVPHDKEVLGGARQGVNDFGKVGYSGLIRSKGKAHVYRFRLLALDGPLEVPEGVNHFYVEQLMLDHVVGQGELLVPY